MASARVLIVDDETETCSLLHEIMEKEGYDVHTTYDGQSALNVVKQQALDVVLSDIQMPGMSGIELLGAIHEHQPRTQVILLTAYGSLNTAIEGIKAGAFDYLSKPFVLDEIRTGVRRAIEHKHSLEESQMLREQVSSSNPLSNIQGNSPALVTVYKLIARVAPTDSTVLIQGESGTGKELIARAIYANSSRKDGPFVAVDCGTLAETLLESELFGHEKGSFTGAVSSKKGLLESAHGGTCFLDEIGDISPVLQSKLLRVLQEHEIRRVGGVASLEVDVRILAATNKNLKKLVEQGKFREDLYYRLNVVTIVLPPLRDRFQDIPTLVDHFLAKYGTMGSKKVTNVGSQAMALLMQYDWPGNVRELEHTIEHAIVMAGRSTIMPQDLPETITSQGASKPASPSAWKTLEQLEREHILRVLEAYHGDEARTAEILGVHRKTIQRKLKEYGYQ
ncbi:MAG: sigma-54 dependent transcriptional regulator [Nitrospirales bacterium]|nr:sigma-54-dependent Fis family transcriptional regulator [Nitrospira sp.]MDR4501150.1 sigma-54 dependent transcriptional regulator [Nitrospirales bacterium]